MVCWQSLWQSFEEYLVDGVAPLALAGKVRCELVDAPTEPWRQGRVVQRLGGDKSRRMVGIREGWVGDWKLGSKHVDVERVLFADGEVHQRPIREWRR